MWCRVHWLPCRVTLPASAIYNDFFICFEYFCTAFRRALALTSCLGAVKPLGLLGTGPSMSGFRQASVKEQAELLSQEEVLERFWVRKNTLECLR